MIYPSLHCECQLHFQASSRPSYHQLGKYIQKTYNPSYYNLTYLHPTKSSFCLMKPWESRTNTFSILNSPLLGQSEFTFGEIIKTILKIPYAYCIYFLKAGSQFLPHVKGKVKNCFSENNILHSTYYKCVQVMYVGEVFHNLQARDCDIELQR